MGWIPDRYRDLRRRTSGDDLDADIEEEFRLHVELRAEENMAGGMSPEDARQEARRRMGDVTRWKAETREVEVSMRHERRRRERFDSLRREVGQAARGLARRPGFTLVAILTLALGIGATTAGFTVLDAVVLRPVPYPEADRLVWVDSPVTAQGADAAWGLSVGGYFELDEGVASLEELGGYGVASVSMTGDLGAYRVRGASVQAGLLDALSARPALGRLIEDPDDDPGAPRVTVLGHGFWQREFGGDPVVIGRTVRIEGEPSEIVGVMEPDFHLPEAEVDVWMPLYLDPSAPAQNSHWVQAMGRLAEGSTLAAAQAEVDRVTERFPELLPEAYWPGFMEEYGFRTRVRPLAEHIIGPEVERSLWIVVAAVGLVLLIACANVANLLLVRSEGRRRELALRSALGAGRSRLATHAMAESLLLTVVGAAAGILLAEGALRMLVSRIPAGLPATAEIAVSWPSVIFALGLALILGLGFGTLPMLGRPVRYGVLREGARGLTEARGGHRVRKAIVTAQVALAVVLLAAAGLLLRSFHELRTVDPGFEASNAVTFQLSLRQPRFMRDPEAVATFLRELTARLEALPAVRSVGAGEALPLGAVACAPVQGEGQAPDPAGSPPCTDKQQVSPGFFAALGTELRGRAPTWSALDAGAGEAVMTDELARRLWPGEDPIGKGVRGSGSAWYRVVGVTEPLRTKGLDAPPAEVVFYPLVAIEDGPLWGTPSSPAIVVRTETEPALASLAPAIRRILEDLAPDVPLGNVETLERHVASSPSVARRSFMMLLMAVAGGMALLLSVVGIYGVISYVVGRRTGELGVRLALGARAGQVVGLVLRDSLLIAAVGVGIGLVAALAVTRTMESLLFGVSAVDPLTLASVTVLILALSLVATWAPARRASRVDPSEALRSE